MQLPVYNLQGQQVNTLEVPESIFGLPLNRDLLHQVVTIQLANQRQPLAHTKDRSEVRGGGKKPWRQKGTGRARHGSIRSPLWKGGGVTFGPRSEKVYARKMNRKMARKALAVALSSKVKDDQLIVVEALRFEQAKTKELMAVFKSLATLLGTPRAKNLLPSVLLIVPADQDGKVTARIARNIPNVDVIEDRNVNTLAVMAHRSVVMAQEALTALQKHLNT